MKKKSFLALALAVFSAASLVACFDTDGGNKGGDEEEEIIGGGGTGEGEGGLGGGSGSGEGSGDNEGEEGGEGEGGDDTEITVTFDAGNGAFENGEKTVKLDIDADGKVSFSQSPAPLDGYAFAGWYNGTVKFDPTKSHTKSAVYTANYISGDDERVYEKLFDVNTVVSFDINMSDAQWKKLDADYRNIYKSPIYRLANSVTISIDSSDFSYDFYYEEVGIRMKGNTSRHEFYDNNGFKDNIHFKMSFGETFDDEAEYTADERKVWADKTVRKARKNRTFGGMEKLDMKYNKNSDESYIKEVYALKFFRDNGIVAQRATLCAVSALNKDVENKNLGVYTLYEPIDSVFLTRNFKNDDNGDLYKCGWSGEYSANLTQAVSNHGNALCGVEDELNGKFYVYDKKTNKKVLNADGQRDCSSITNFITAINSQGANFGELLDTNYFARFEALNYILGNPDCIRNNYNNYYIYFRPSDGKAIFIPTDYDRCFGIKKGWEPYHDVCLNLKPYDKRTSGNDQVNPIYVNLIVDGAPSDAGSVRAKYRDYLLQFSKSEMLKVSEFDKVKNAYKAHYEEVPKTAIDSNNTRFDADNTGNYSYSYYIERKLDILEKNINF